MSLRCQRAFLRSLYAVRAFSTANLSEPLRKRIESYVASAPVVVFMKGTQQEPMCGFSRNVKLVLDFHEVKFKDYNVLEDSDLREGIKKFSDWPTIPQVYVNGNFVGGCDILVQMHKEGEITEFFEKEGIKSRFSDNEQGHNEK
uniref:Glutaredoxin-related protein 5, mitochondrial n=2 Tax=Ascaris TaxID=6251 RepID=F1LGR0_ASCSU